MTRKGLIKQVLETFGLDVGTANGKITSAKGKPLAKHVHGVPPSGDFDYSSVVGIFCILLVTLTLTLLMLSTIHVLPKLVHKQALKKIGHYLKATVDQGLIMKPSENFLKIDSFLNANFARMYRHKEMDDPVCVKSRTGY
ncbi:hypothetical protein ACHAXS_000093, partial [Conticribra weissflogii]